MSGVFRRNAIALLARRTRTPFISSRWSQTTHASANRITPAAAPAVLHRNISKVLIANRGEIACRIIRTAKKMGIRTVAVYSDPDKSSLHVEMVNASHGRRMLLRLDSARLFYHDSTSKADEAYHIGPASTNESYLNDKRIIQAALRSGAQAIHPGYGFLSQSPEFAQVCADNNITFVGPSPRAIMDMGIKSTSKTLMQQAGVPVIQGYHGDDQSVERLRAEAKKIGYPIMIKAFRGGGGKGMRVVLNEAEFDQQLESAKRESLKSFGDDAMLVEKYVQRPRHVEVQVFGDHYGNCVYLFERDCSVQRRHQKIIEEAPAPNIPEETRRSIGEAAVRAAQAVDYVGAGTVEFILDAERHEFFFMEMNTRLQVEHPVTEMITGTDLVAWQLKVAAGEPLPVLQKDLRIRGHSFEARVYAENPEDNFMPGAGPLTHLSLNFDPALFDGTVRVESGVRQGDQVSVHYDPMIAKLVVWGEDRLSALRKLRNLLGGYHPGDPGGHAVVHGHIDLQSAPVKISLFVAFVSHGTPREERQTNHRLMKISGLSTNINFLMRLCDSQSFQNAEVHTDFIQQHYQELFPDDSRNLLEPESLAEAALGVLFLERGAGYLFSDPFDIEKDWRINSSYFRNVKLKSGKDVHDVQVRTLSNGQFAIHCSETTMNVEARSEWKSGVLEVKATIDGKTSVFKVIQADRQLQIFKENGSVTYDLPPHKYESQLSTLVGGADEARAPMPGVVEKVMVQPGQDVQKGDSLIVMIAMKMEYVIKAPRAGRVKQVSHKSGDNVKKGTQLVFYEES